MYSPGGLAPLSYRRIGRADLGVIFRLELDRAQVERFLGPIPDILAAVRRGPAHALVGIEATGGLVGFFVLHPDRRDRACWWLGWFALDRRAQGNGHGRAAMAEIMGRLRRIDACRRVRLLVAPDNEGARRLYERAGFRPAGVLRATGELILECALPARRPGAAPEVLVPAVAAVEARRVFRHVRLRSVAGPHPAWVIGVERGPPEVDPARLQAGLVAGDAGRNRSSAHRGTARPLSHARGGIGSARFHPPGTPDLCGSDPARVCEGGRGRADEGFFVPGRVGARNGPTTPRRPCVAARA